MAYERGPQISSDGFSRLKVPQKWLWAWDGLVFCSPMWEPSGGPVDLISGTTSTIVGTVTPTPSFISVEQNLAVNGLLSFGDVSQVSILSDVTVAAMHTPTGTGQSAIVCYADDGSIGCPYALVYSFTSNTKYSFWNDNSGTAVSTTATYGTDTRNFVIARRIGPVNSSHTLDIAVNGAAFDEDTTAVTGDYGAGGATVSLSINRFGAFDGYKGGGIVGPIYIWNRALSKVETDALFDDPYGPIRQVSQEYSFLYVNLPVTASPGLQTVSITGFAPTVTNAPDPPVYVGVGTVAVGDHTAVLSPGLHASVAAGDLLITVAFLRNAGTLSINSGWTQHSLVDTTQNGIGYYLQTWYRFATGSGDAATVTPSGGSTSPQSMTCAFTLAFRNIYTSSPFGIDGTDSFNAANANVGPINAPHASQTVGAVIVFGVRTGTVGTGIATLSGDSLTWVESVEQFNTVNSLGISVACDYAIWSGGAPTLTDKTFTITGGTASPGFGKMFLLNAPSFEIFNQTASPGTQSVALTGFAPGYSLGATLFPGVGSLVISYPSGIVSRSTGILMQYVNTPDSTPSSPQYVWTH